MTFRMIFWSRHLLKPMRILGVDPGLHITGYGVVDFDKHNCTIVEAGIIRTATAQPLTKRLKKIYHGIAQLIDEVKPEVMVLEKLYAHHRHPATAFLLGHARAMACLVSEEKKIPLAEYSATHVKKAVLGRGNASKYQVQRMVTNMLSLAEIPKYADVTDALALAIAHTHVIRR